MHFNRTHKKDPSPSFKDRYYDENFWIAGNYKILQFNVVNAGSNSINPIQFTVKHAAYVKNHGVKSWGNHVNPAEQFYYSLEAAKAACEHHYEESQL